jgi:hypothetical protein
VWSAPPLPVSDAGDVEPSIAPIVDRIGPPISTTPWSPDLVAQTLEILTVFRREEELFCLTPIHAQSLRVGLAKSEQPGDHVLRALAWYPLAVHLVHSTSWRFEQGDVVLTYVAVVDEPERLPRESLVAVPVARTELARGGATGAPGSIEVAQVLEHALRHLAWLLRDDPVVGAALADWAGALRDYVPEPFRAL